MTYFWVYVALGCAALGALAVRDHPEGVTYTLFVVVVMAVIGSSGTFDTEDGKVAYYCKIWAFITMPLLLVMVYSLVYTN